MANNLADDLKKDAEIQAILVNVMYLVKYYDVNDGSTLKVLLEAVEKNKSKMKEEDLRAYDKIVKAVEKILSWEPLKSTIKASHRSTTTICKA